MKKQRIISCLLWAMALLLSLPMAAFEGSDLTSGQTYYLFNIYQSKFLGADNKLQAPNIGTPLAFTASASGFTIGGKAYTATKNAAGFYQLKNGSNFFAFEDKVNDPDSPDDENRRMYLCGGVLCKNTTNDTDRSYWQLISETEYAEWQAKKKFTVASLNVDGMPKSVSLLGQEIKLNPDATEGPGADEIGRHLLASGFDVVGVSENFNYHSNIWDIAWNGGTGNHYNSMTHRGNITVGNANLTNYLSKKPLFDLDGLNVYYRIDGATTVAQPSNESWTQWNDHYGYTDNGADGLIKKGFRYYLVTLADGTEIDLYTMHMDAESDKEDCDARTSQMRQLVNVIKATHNGRPIVIIGDSNCRYTRDTVKKDLIDAINEDERFTIRDPWIMFGRNNSYPAYGSGSISAADNGYRTGEVVDKIWFINNTESNIRLVAETYHQDLSFVASQDVDGTSLKQGSPLCDHKPCVVTFSYHQYDPVIDDVAVVETTEEAVYLRNRETGRYLMNGGWWGSHAVVGNYPKEMYVKPLPGGKYSLESKYGHFTDAAYLDNNNSAEYISEWTILEEDGYKVFSYNQNGQQKALTANDPTFFNDNPLYRYVTTAPLNVKDKLQQWEIVTQAQLAEEMAKATPLNPVNATHLVKSANFDRIDWGGAGWTFDNKGNGDRVSQSIGGADNDAFSNFNWSVNTKQSGTIIKNSNNQWDCYQELSVPAGYYYITCQGFEQTTSNTYLYAWTNAPSNYTVQQVKLQALNTTLESNDSKGAGRAFDQGLYNNALPIVQVGNDGILVIGVKKTENNSSSGWQVFDNFQLIYLGTEAPEPSYYLYNVESGMFLNGGNAHGTQASVADDGQEWTPQYKSSGVQLLRKNQSNGLFVAGDGLYVDGATPENWHGTGYGNGAFSLAPTNNRENVIGWTSEAKGTVVRDKFIKDERELTDGIHWKAIPQSQYASYKTTAAANKTARLAAVDIYRTAMLDANIDASDFKALWNNPTTTADQITSAAATLKTAIENGAQENASDTKPYNVSYRITNATCGDEAHTGWAKTGDWGSNTGATHATDGLVLGPRFFESWVASTDALPNKSIKQVLNSLPAGFYKLSFDAIAVRQNSNAAVTGANLYAKVGSAERVTTACSTPNSKVTHFETPEFVVNAGESVEIGLSLENTNANWVAFDNWQLIYLGPIYTANMTVKEGKYATFVAPFDVKMPDGVTAYTATLNDAKTSVNLKEAAGAGSTLTAGTPVILGGSPVNQNFTGKRPAEKMISDGTLVGFYWNYADDNSCVITGDDSRSYVLQTQNGKQAFYQVDPGQIFKGTANRCYLVTPNSSEVKQLNFFFDDEETAIETVTTGNGQQTNGVYDPSGRKMAVQSADAVRKGVYIKNGKKYVK